MRRDKFRTDNGYLCISQDLAVSKSSKVATVGFPKVNCRVKSVESRL